MMTTPPTRRRLASGPPPPHRGLLPDQRHSGRHKSNASSARGSLAPLKSSIGAPRADVRPLVQTRDADAVARVLHIKRARAEAVLRRRSPRPVSAAIHRKLGLRHDVSTVPRPRREKQCCSRQGPWVYSSQKRVKRVQLSAGPRAARRYGPWRLSPTPLRACAPPRLDFLWAGRGTRVYPRNARSMRHRQAAAGAGTSRASPRASPAFDSSQVALLPAAQLLAIIAAAMQRCVTSQC